MKHIVSRLVLAGLGLLSASLMAWAQTDSTYGSTSLGVYPPNIGYGTGGPMMMLTASRDHTLFSPIYTDYEDIDGDGTDDYTFKPTFRYYGYFDASKCYSYNAARTAGAGARFEPAVAAVTVGEGKAARLTCPSSGRFWSGNFLNWATMTRVDVVRKTLYGGFRREDTLTETTLEMAQMSFDAHAFVKYYSGSDIRSYTPFDASGDLQGAGLTLCSRGSNQYDPSPEEPGYPMIRVAKGNYSLWGTTPYTVCNWSDEQEGFSFGSKSTAFYRKYGPTQGGTDPTAHKAELPNKSLNGATYNGIGPELAVRVQVCKADLIGQERCSVYRDPLDANATPVYKPIGLLQEFGTTFQASQPARAEFGLITGSYDSNLRGGALRKNIASMNDEVDFATGRFCHNITSNLPVNCRTKRGDPTAQEGAPRVGIVKAFDSVRLYNPGNYNATTDSVSGFVLPEDIRNGELASWGNPMSEMVVQALSYFSGQSLGLTGTETWARDADVGLPVGVPRADPLNDTAIDPVANLSRSQLYGKGICRPMHMLAISSGSVSYDTNEPGSGDDVYDQATGFMGANGGTGTLVTRTDAIGGFEGINGTSRSVGSAQGGFGADCTGKAIGAGSTIGEVYTVGLSAVAGVCPEAPGIKGSYLGAGAAFLANTSAVRELGGDGRASSLTAATGAGVSRNRLPAHALRVKSYAASLAGGVARIEVPIPGTTRKVFITPESSWNHPDLGGRLMPGAMLTFKAINVTGSSGSYVVTWNDAQFGGDYDMDLVGFLRWEMRPSAARPGAYELTVMTDVLNHEAGAQGSHGFSIIGTKASPGAGYFQDGRYLTHGSNGYAASGSDCAALAVDSVEFALRCQFSSGGMFTGADVDGYNWPTSIDGGTNNVVFRDEVVPGRYTTTVAKTFLVEEGAANVTLRDPLWYIAKYGSFDTGEKEFALSTQARPQDSAGGSPVNWDRLSNTGATCTAGNCADGEPDGYFLARRPELLEERLRTLFNQITQSSNSSPAVSSAQLISGSLKYTAEFSRDSFGGNIRAFRLAEDGQFENQELWNASAKLKSPSGPRQVITNSGSQGLAFDWAALGNQADYLAAVLGVPPETTLTEAQRNRVRDLIGYMRGESTREGQLFRVRSAGGIMGPIVNSTPWLQDAKAGARYTDADFPDGAPSYRSFVIGRASSRSVLWVGSNDGMLHGIDALTGDPLMSYVPSPLLSRLATSLNVANTEAVALMDGSPFVADVMVGSGTGRRWASYLFSSLGRGGKAVFALDVSSSSNLTEGQASSVFKWMFTAADDSDLGFQLVDPVRHNASGQASQVAYLNNGEFGLLVPNGHRSASGSPVLFILFAAGPGTGGWRDASGNPVGYRKLTTRADSGNGLMGVTWVDLDNNGTADVVYGTDLKGSLWKFDIRSSDIQQWGSALIGSTTTAGANGSTTTTTVQGPKPLFTAVGANGQAQPITTAPVTFFPSFGGTMISFGTGRSLESGDFPDTSTVQRFYSVWDKGRYAEDVINPVATNGTANPLPSLGATRTVSGVSASTFVRRILRRDPLTEDVYQIQVDADGTPTLKDGAEVRLRSNDVTQRFDPAVHDGWYMDFPGTGEAVLSSPVRRLNFVFFTTVRPLSATEGEASCSLAPRGALYAFNPVNGLPVNGLLQGGEFLMGQSSGNDQKMIVVRNNSDDGSVGTGGKDCVPGSKGCVCVTPDKCEKKPECESGKINNNLLGTSTGKTACSSASNLRLQWREIPGMRTRGAVAAEPEPEPEPAPAPAPTP